VKTKKETEAGDLKNNKKRKKNTQGTTMEMTTQ
jgi:hypothetical protein